MPMNLDKLFRKRLSDLIKWYDPEFKYPSKKAKDILHDLKNTIENSNCPTCDESDQKSHKNKYPPQIWTCDECNVTISAKNKVNHKRSNRHKYNLSRSTSEESE